MDRSADIFSVLHLITILQPWKILFSHITLPEYFLLCSRNGSLLLVEIRELAGKIADKVRVQIWAFFPF